MIFGDGIRQFFELIRYFYAAYPARSTVMLLSITVAALAEGIGIAALLPLINLVISPEGTEGAQGVLMLYVERAFAFAGLKVTIDGLLIVIVVMITAKALLMMVAMTQVGYAAAHVTKELRLKVIRALLTARWHYFVHQRTGDFASAVGTEPLRAAMTYVSACRVMAGVLLLAARRSR